MLEYPEQMAGNWNQFFGNNNPIVLELACGRGEYALGLASMHPYKNFLGVDVKGNRIYIGAKRALDDQLQNVGFLRTQIEMISKYFTHGEVDEIWITFPDPQLRWSKAKHRLTHPGFLRLYQHFLAPGGYINLKTDSPDLYQFTHTVIGLHQLELIENISDVYAHPVIAPELTIKTHYEKLNISKSNKVFYLKFKLPTTPLQNLDETLRAITKPNQLSS